MCCSLNILYIKTYIDIINAFSVTEKSNASMMNKKKKKNKYKTYRPLNLNFI